MVTFCTIVLPIRGFLTHEDLQPTRCYLSTFFRHLPPMLDHDPPEQSRMLLLHGVDLDLAKTCIDPIKGFGTTMKVALVFKAV